MNLPALQVLIGFGTTPGQAGVFTLGRSKLGGSDTLSGPTVMVDVTRWATGQGITSTRGRSREVDAYQAGTLQLSLRNEDRRFDPTNTTSPYYPGIVPRAPVQVFVAGEQIFGGYVDDYDVQYTKPNVCVVAITAVDGFGLLASTKLAGAAFSQELSGARVNEVVTRPEVGYPGGVSVDDGQMTVQASTQDGVDPLSYLQTIAASEGGWLFVDREGVLTFHENGWGPAQVLATRSSGVGVAPFMTFTDASPAASGYSFGYTDVGMISAVTLLYNRVEGTRNGGTKQTADDAASQASFGIRTLSLPQLENADDLDVANLCAYYLGRYSRPEVRFDQVVVELASYPPALQAVLAQLDIGADVVVVRTPPGGGSPAHISQESLVERIGWSISPVGSCKLTLGLMNLTNVVGFILDSAEFGVVGVNKLGL